MLYMLYHFFTPYPVCEIIGKHLKIAEWPKQLAVPKLQEASTFRDFALAEFLDDKPNTYLNTYQYIECMNVKPSGTATSNFSGKFASGIRTSGNIGWETWSQNYLGPEKFPIWKFVVHPVAGRRFLRNEALRICHQGSEIARGIINFSSEELWGAQCNGGKWVLPRNPWKYGRWFPICWKCSPPIWEMIHFDFWLSHIFQVGWNHETE